MSVPITELVSEPPLAQLVEDFVGDASVRARGLFRPELVKALREGQAVPSDTRRRRVGERVWTLVMLEAWLRRFVDLRGEPPR